MSQQLKKNNKRLHMHLTCVGGTMTSPKLPNNQMKEIDLVHKKNIVLSSRVLGTHQLDRLLEYSTHGIGTSRPGPTHM